ncbi:MAG: class I SAM-dependent methyltransferase [Acidobacteriota bacterium]|nr:class I SAM-dependent methyltransferase [Acidobacteriota bacterium]
MSEKIFNPLEHPVCLEFPLWLEETAWAGHIPFAMFITSAFRPRVFVELGTFRGASYCAFCQAVKSVKTKTKCFAVDTWQGDAHAGQIEREVLVKLKAYHDPLYGDFSRLVESTFDDALDDFADGSIDLLHIDGFHTYEAVRHDFETWQPKMSKRGIVLFHDTTVRERDFGVWKFWDEVKENRPHFEFSHAHGLGVLFVGEDLPEELQLLFAADENQTAVIRSFFNALGERVEWPRHYQTQSERVEELQKYENIVKNSRLIQKYHALRKDGLGSLLKKPIG